MTLHISKTGIGVWDTEAGGYLAYTGAHLPQVVREAHARLFLAAPDLLAACKAALPLLATAPAIGLPGQLAEVLARLNVAIARAESGDGPDPAGSAAPQP